MLSEPQALPRVHAASILHAFYRLLEKAEEVESWKAFIERLDVPEATKRIYLKRSDLVLERSKASKAFLVL